MSQKNISFICCFLIIRVIATAQDCNKEDGLKWFSAAESFMEQGIIDSAKIYYTLAKSDFREDCHEQLMICDVGLSVISYYKEDLDAMKSHLESGDKIRKKYLSETNDKYYLLDDLFAVYFESTGNYNRSLELAEKSLQRNLKSLKPDSASLTNSYTLIGLVHMNMGNFEKAARYFHKAAEITNENLSQVLDYRLADYLNLGAVYNSLRKYNRALEYLEKAKIETPKTVRDTNHIIQLNNNLGNTLSRKGDLEKARESFQKALELANQTGYAKASVLFNYGDYYKKKGEHKLASEYFRNALDVRLQKRPFNHPSVANNYAYLGKSFYEVSEHDSALFYVQKALQSIVPSFVSGDWRENPDGNELTGSETYLVRILNKKGEILTGMYEQFGNPEYLETAHDCFKKIIPLIKNIRAGYITKSSKEFFSSEVNDILENGIRTAELYYQKNPSETNKSAVFEWLEYNKALTLLENSNDREARKFGNIPTEILDEERDLKVEIAYYEKQLYEAIALKKEAKEARSRSVLFEKREKFENLTSELENKYPKYAAAKHEIEPVVLADMEIALDKKTLLVEYEIIESDKKKELFITIVQKGKTDLLKFEIEEDFEQKLSDYYYLIQQFTIARMSNRKRFIELTNYFYEKLIQPIENQMIGKANLVFVNDEILWYLPFEILFSEPDIKDFNEFNYLLRNYKITYQYSATLYFKQLASEPKAYDDNRLFAFAPVFKENSTVFMPEAEGNRSGDSENPVFRGDGFKPLLGSEAEVKTIQDLFSEQSISTDLLLNEEATETNLKTVLTNAPRYVHIATHSFANLNYSNFSGLACWRQSLDEDADDGILYVNEISTFDMKTDLVVLSSCESGVGRLIEGEGLMGLNRGFIIAGVPNVLFSLWKVEDDATSQMMTAFYKEMLSGKPFGHALRDAKLKMMNDPVSALPLYWSGFVLAGN